MTQVIRLDPERPRLDAIEQAGSIIRDGGLVAFPTETVYGLGADAMNERAVQRIFDAKGRPPNNPLIVHVTDRQMLDHVAIDVNEKAQHLIERFWPGPLTLVLERSSKIAPSVSAGLSTVAVRMPANTIALELLRAARTPIAAPSANSSGRPSPTLAAHVVEDLGGSIDMILDGGPTEIGIESTVLDVTVEPAVILRPGWITLEELTREIGAVASEASSDELRRSPGTRHPHYSPRAKVVLVEGGSRELIEGICRKYLREGAVGFIGHTPISLDDGNFHSIVLGSSARDYAKEIYAALRELDREDVRVIIVQSIAEHGEGAAVMDRLRRASVKRLDFPDFE
jgi:L-threonylcarbamoyladenylate synthase